MNNYRNSTTTQEEAHAIYQSLLEWISRHQEWLIGGDFNEVRDIIDRLRSDGRFPKPRRKFINEFLAESRGYDVWRTFYPKIPGLTHKSDGDTSRSRIDYFLAGALLIQQMNSIQMEVGDFDDELKLDHARISFAGVVPILSDESRRGKPWSIPQPNLSSIQPTQKTKCQEDVNLALQPLLLKIREGDIKFHEADTLSKTLAKILVEVTSATVGNKLPTHEKGKYQSSDMVKSQAKINTISKARDLIRTLFLDEVRSPEDRKSVEDHLSVLLDRLCIMGVQSLPLSLDIHSLHQWSQSTAPEEISCLRNYMKARKCTMDQQETEHRRKLFLDPKKRGKWYDHVYEARVMPCPNFAIDCKTGTKTFDPAEVKRIYMEEGAAFFLEL